MRYSEKLKDPRWQKKRLEIMNRDNFSCQSCCAIDKTLHVHHRIYLSGKEPWEYENHLLVTLCEECHNVEGLNKSRAKDDIYNALAAAGMLNDDIISLADLITQSGIKDVFFPAQWGLLKTALTDPEVYKILQAKYNEAIGGSKNSNADL